MPSRSSDRSTTATSASIFTPRAASTSAEPLRLEIARLPCLATGTPAAAVTSAAAVLTLNVRQPSPPVPQVSISRCAAMRIGVMCRRMAIGGAGNFLRPFRL